jgi:hypothetical protein
MPATFGSGELQKRAGWGLLYLSDRFDDPQLVSTEVSAIMQSHQQVSPMLAYRAKRDSEHRSVLDSYTILGFISSGTVS